MRLLTVAHVETNQRTHCISDVCAFERGTTGCFDVMDFKANLRRIFGIETPKDEKGISAMLGKADATMSKMGNELPKKMGKIKVQDLASLEIFGTM